MHNIISLKNVNKTYGSAENALHVLKNIQIEIQSGEYVSILGASGSGKSTLMNVIGCMDTMDSGSYTLCENDIASLSQDELATIRNEKIGFVFQKYHLLSQYNILQNVMMPLLLRGQTSKEAKEQALKCISEVGLQERILHLPKELSGGQQQRVAIARALVTSPSLLLADEPTGALDAATGKEILSLFKALNDKGNTIIQITHDASVAAVSKRIIKLQDGEIVS